MENQEEYKIQESLQTENDGSINIGNTDSQPESTRQTDTGNGTAFESEYAHTSETVEMKLEVADPQSDEVASSVNTRNESAPEQSYPEERTESVSSLEDKEPSIEEKVDKAEETEAEETGAEKTEQTMDAYDATGQKEDRNIQEGYPTEMPMNFIPYNTDMEQLRLPEYGRKIQELIQYCKTIPDREERTACAYAISEVMGRLFPGVLGEKGDRKKIWDHMNIMAGFELDIDFPVEVLTREELNPKPTKIEYNRKPIRYRHYGRTLELMIEKASKMEECEQKDHLIMLIANQMKKQLLAHNKEGVSDAKVLKDLADYTKGRIVLDPQNYPLHEYNEVNNKQPLAKKKRKK